MAGLEFMARNERGFDSASEFLRPRGLEETLKYFAFADVGLEQAKGPCCRTQEEPTHATQNMQ